MSSETTNHFRQWQEYRHSIARATLRSTSNFGWHGGFRNSNNRKPGFMTSFQKVDNSKIGDYNLKHLRGNMSLVGQEPVLFSGTILENVKLGVPGATQKQVEDACQIADAKGFIERLPKVGKLMAFFFCGFWGDMFVWESRPEFQNSRI